MLRARLTTTRFTAAVCSWSILTGAALLAASCSSEPGTDGSSAGGAPVFGLGGASAGSGGARAAMGGASGGGAFGSSGSSGQAAGGSGSGAGTAGAASGGVAGTIVSGAGDSGSGGTAGAALDGSSGAGGGSTSGGGGTASGGSSGGGAGGGPTTTGPFVCNQLTGGKLTEEWFIAGFEKAVDNSRWQVKWREDAYVEVWADAQSSFWTAQVDSPCANSTNLPDRVVFGAVSFKYKTQAEWRTGITQAVNNFKAKWPSVRRVDLVTQIRGPKNMLCPTAPIAGETIAVPPEQDAAMADVAGAFPGFVFVGPKVLAKSCSDFQGGGPHLTSAGNQANVSVFSDYFVQIQ